MPRLSSITTRNLTGIGLAPLLPTRTLLVSTNSSAPAYAWYVEDPAADWVSATFSTENLGSDSYLAGASAGSTAIVISRQGKVQRTLNGDAWTQLSNLPALSPATTTTWGGLAYGAGTWVTVAGGNSNSTQVAYSVNDGITWTSINPLTSTQWKYLEYANGIFLALDGVTPGISAFSTDGITWTAGGALPNGGPFSLVYATGLGWYTIRGDTANTIRVISSIDNGITWSSNTYSATGAGGTMHFAWGRGQFVGVRESSTSSFTSLDGVNWTVNTDVFGGTANQRFFSAIEYINGAFIATTSGFSTFVSTIWRSTDGVNWSLPDTPPTPTVNSGRIAIGFVAPSSPRRTIFSGYAELDLDTFTEILYITGSGEISADILTGMLQMSVNDTFNWRGYAYITLIDPVWAGSAGYGFGGIIFFDGPDPQLLDAIEQSSAGTVFNFPDPGTAEPVTLTLTSAFVNDSGVWTASIAEPVSGGLPFSGTWTIGIPNDYPATLIGSIIGDISNWSFPITTVPNPTSPNLFYPVVQIELTTL